MNIKNLVISILFVIVGALLIRYALVRPCEIAAITQTVQGQEIVVNQPAQLDRIICMSTDYMAIISLLIGTAMVFPGVSGLYRSLTEPIFDVKGKGKKSKKK